MLHHRLLRRFHIQTPCELQFVSLAVWEKAMALAKSGFRAFSLRQARVSCTET